MTALGVTAATRSELPEASGKLTCGDEISPSLAYSPYSLTVKFRGAGGELADPSNLRLTWSPADAVLTSSALQKVSTGTYQLDSRFGAPGQKSFTLSYTLVECSGESPLAVYVT